MSVPCRSGVVFDLADWGDLWTAEAAIPSNLSCVQIEGTTDQIWKRSYNNPTCAFCGVRMDNLYCSAIFCVNCDIILYRQKEFAVIELRNKKRVSRTRKPVKPRKTRSRAVADDSTETL